MNTTEKKEAGNSARITIMRALFPLFSVSNNESKA